MEKHAHHLFQICVDLEIKLIFIRSDKLIINTCLTLSKDLKVSPNHCYGHQTRKSAGTEKNEGADNVCEKQRIQLTIVSTYIKTQIKP